MIGDASIDPFTYLKIFVSEPEIDLLLVVCDGYVAPARVFATPMDVLTRTVLGSMVVDT
jgi:hypothetical protein